VSTAVLTRTETAAPDMAAELAALRAEVARVRAQLVILRRAHDALDCDITAAGVAASHASERAADIEYRIAAGGAL
jgi:hypothetical protein